jgi:hypothetical protein
MCWLSLMLFVLGSDSALVAEALDPVLTDLDGIVNFSIFVKWRPLFSGIFYEVVVRRTKSRPCVFNFYLTSCSLTLCTSWALAFAKIHQ